MLEREEAESATRDASEEQKDIEINISSRHQALEKILRDIKQMVGDETSGLSPEERSHLQEELKEHARAHSEATPLERAQELVYKAWETTGIDRAELAVNAIEISEDCADAYVILGEETSKTPEEALQIYEMAVRAGERALGSRAFRENVGEFWDIVEAHPYMRARTKLARALWVNGDHRRAIIHYKELLRLDSGDSQGIRYDLMNCLLEEGLHQEVKELIVEYRGDQTAAWLYSRALWSFVRYGPGVRSSVYLKEAFQANQFVPAYILSVKELPEQIPDYYGWGDENEAIVYAHDALSTWRRIEGAIDWFDKSRRSFAGGPPA
jgi:tetratricopeptide (TPR) repeat protein